MAQETIVLVSNLSDKFVTAQDDINNNFNELYAGSPPTLTGNALKYLRVNAGETATEWVSSSASVAWGAITGTLSSQTDLQSELDAKVTENAAITGATKTKITYDSKGLVTSGSDAAFTDLSDVPANYTGAGLKLVRVNATPNALEFVTADKTLVGLSNVANVDTTTTANITDSTNKRFITDAQQTVLGNTSGTNTGDQTSIVGITGTMAQFDTACSDGNFLFVGDQPSLSSANAFVTATTTINSATYIDITGASITLAPGKWLIIAQVVGAFPNAIIQMFVAITDGSNNVISEVAQSRPASGTASLNSPMSCNLTAFVSPAISTTYKLRGARGLTTHTGSWTVYDGNGVNTANHATNNSDKGTGIFAIRIA
jgi:hypothetical protein